MSQKADLRFYEEILVLHPDTAETEQKRILSESVKIMEGCKGALHHLDCWGSRPIVNRGKKVTRGWYFHAVFSATAGAVAEITRKLRINDRVVYFHHERLAAGVSPKKHIEDFHRLLVQSSKREQDRVLKMQKRAGASNGAYSSKRH